MNSISRWDPFRDMWNMRRMMDQVFDSAFDRQLADWQPEAWGLALDVTENEDEYVVKASIPGVNPDDLEITYNDDTLTIKGEIKEDKNVEEERYHLRERRYGKFARSISLPARVNSDQIQAHYDAGVLTLQLPKSEEVKPKRIAIQSGGDKMLEGKFKQNAKQN
jgi:HSP20 family protein